MIELLFPFIYFQNLSMIPESSLFSVVNLSLLSLNPCFNIILAHNLGKIIAQTPVELLVNN